jgi:hypothetical protein
MLLELMNPIALMLNMLSLCAVFNAAFLHPDGGMEQRISECALLLALSAGLSWSSGMIFREANGMSTGSVMRTLPMQMFCWAAGAMVLLFLAAWYLEANGIFYRDLRRM